tara:strand:- start:2218 stop:3066 length:849 start_codon:yes stop_codon:yes gene_type:complete
MKTLIIGSGFGIYGYLPAAISFSKIYLNKKYKKKIQKRKDLKKHINKISWYLNIKSIINQIDHVIIAQKPKNQINIVRKILKYSLPRYFFLEKPIANTPLRSLNLINLLKKNKVKFSTGYLFKYLNWYKFLNNNLNQNKKFKIIWEIKKKSSNNTWKYNHHEGGGILRFYSIHFIRALFDLQFTEIIKKTINKKQWHINAQDIKDNSLDICVKFSNINKFKFYMNNTKIFVGPNPFLKKIIKYNDPRVKIIKNYLKDNLKKKYINFIYEKDFVNFWKNLEIN